MPYSKPTFQGVSPPAPHTPKNADLLVGEPEHPSPLRRNFAVEQRSPLSLKTNPRNARTHSKRQVKAIAASIEAFGFTTPILIDDDDMILSGHGRLQAAKLLGLDRVPTIRISDLSEAQKRALVLAQNKLAERAGWDRELLALELSELSCVLPDLGLSVDLTGFEIAEIEDLVATGGKTRGGSRDTDDDWPALAPTSVSRSGDLWLLGRHRLLCSEARQPGAVLRVLEDRRADLVFTDLGPLRHQPHAPTGAESLCPGLAMNAGETSDTGPATPLQQVLGNAVTGSREGAYHFLCTDWRSIHEVLTVGGSIYGELKDLIVWLKRKDHQQFPYCSQHELIAVFQVGGNADTSGIGRSRGVRSNVWQYPDLNPIKYGRTNRFDTGLSFKPVALVADAIKEVTHSDAIVLDVVAGAGTTLIAAERVGRQAALVEGDPRFVDLAIARFAKLSGNEAIHGATGKTHAELARERCSGTTER